MPQPAAPAGEAARFRVVGFFRRAIAALIDACVLLPLVLVFGGAASVVAGGQLPRAGEIGFGYVVQLAVDGGAAGLAALAMAGIVVLLYFFVFTAATGQTPGLRLVRARIIDAYGEAPSFPRSLIRVFAAAVAVALLCLGWLWIAFSREKRGLHDLVAGTWVVLVEPAAATTSLEAAES
jgi:uncharacterized RDD family membrane protein YckC